MGVLVIGGGSIGKRHIKNLHDQGIHEVYCLRRQLDSEFEEEFKTKILTSYTEASQYTFDAVFICTPTALHNEGLKFAVDNNIPVFIEKPLIHSADGLKEAHEILAGYSNVFFIGFMLRFHPLVKAIKDIVDSKELGEVYHARFEFGSFLPYWHPWEDHKTSYASRIDLGGGVINTITHELDLIQYLFGKPSSLYCEAYNFNKLGIEVEEMCEATFEYSNKLVSLHLDYLQKDYDRNIKILFDEGKVIWNWHDNEVKIVKHNAETSSVFLKEDFNVNQLYVDEVACFFDLIKKNAKTHDLDKYHALENNEIMLKMHESVKRKQKLSL